MAEAESVADVGAKSKSGLGVVRNAFKRVSQFGGTLFANTEVEEEQDDGIPVASKLDEENVTLLKTKRLEALQKAQRQLCRPVGLLMIHIKKYQLFNIDFDTLFKRRCMSVYLRVSVQNQTKNTAIYDEVYIPASLDLDDMKFFRLTVDDKRSDRSNVIRFELIVIGTKNDDQSVHFILSETEIHIFDLIKELYSMHTFGLRYDGNIVCEIETEVSFGYGQNGYGYSNQFENRQRSSKLQIKHSAFLRVQPDLIRGDTKNDVITSCPVGHPAFIDFKRKAEFVDGQDESFNYIDRFKKVEDPRILKSKIGRKIKRMEYELDRCESRQSRLSYLKKLVRGGGVEREVNPQTFEVGPDFGGIRRKMKKLAFHDADTSNIDLDAHTEDLQVLIELLEKAPGMVQRNERVKRFTEKIGVQEEVGLLGKFRRRLSAFSTASIIPAGFTLPSFGRDVSSVQRPEATADSVDTITESPSSNPVPRQKIQSMLSPDPTMRNYNLPGTSLQSSGTSDAYDSCPLPRPDVN